MKISNLVSRITNLVIEQGDFEDTSNTIIIVKNEDGTYTEVTSNDND